MATKSNGRRMNEDAQQSSPTQELGAGGVVTPGKRARGFVWLVSLLILVSVGTFIALAAGILRQVWGGSAGLPGVVTAIGLVALLGLLFGLFRVLRGGRVQSTEPRRGGDA